MIPLEQWTIILNRPVRMDILESARKHGVQPDCSNLSFKDAYPLLKHICKEWYGDFQPFEFGVLKNKDRLGYSVSLTITRPDDIAIEFSATRDYSDKNDAKLHAALLAVKEGAIRFILDCPASVAQTAPSISALATVPVHRARANDCRVSGHPTKRMTSALPGEDPKDALNPAAKQLINHAVQGAFQDRKIAVPKNAQEWNVVEKDNNCFAAQLTVTMPSGVSETYGDIENPRKTYPSDKEARIATATQAIDAGVLLFIAAERLRNYHSPDSNSSTSTLSLSRDQTLPRAKTVTSFPSNAVPSSNSVSEHLNIGPLPLTLSNSAPSKQSPSPLRLSSPTLGPSILFDPSSSSGRGTKRTRSEDDMSDDSALGTSLPMIILFPPCGPKIDMEVSSRVNQTGRLEVPPPLKKQKTTPVVVRAAIGNPIGKSRAMYGPTYSQILSDFCAQTGLALPKFFYEQQNDGAYKVVLLVDGSRYDLEKGYQTVEMAKERLSKRFLALKDITSVKK